MVKLIQIRDSLREAKSDYWAGQVDVEAQAANAWVLYADAKYDDALKATLAAPLRFFDATPIGRILNRFSSDVDAVERQLLWSFEATVRAVFATIGSICVLLSVLPLIGLVIVPVLAVFFRMQGTYRASAREAC